MSTINWLLVATAVLYFGAAVWETVKGDLHLAAACVFWGLGNIALGVR